MATLSGDKAMEKAAARHPGEDKSLMAAGTKDRQQPLRFIRQAKAAQNQADEETTHPQAVSDPSLLDDVPGQVPASPAQLPASKGPSRKPSPVSSPSMNKRGAASTEPEVTATPVPVAVPPLKKPEPKQSNLVPEFIGKVKRPADDQQQRYKQHLAYLQGLGSNTYRMAVDEGEPGVDGSPSSPERGAIEAELALMLQGLKDDLREKVPLLPEVEAMEQTATTSAESQQIEDSQSDASGAGYRPRGLPAASTVEDLSQAMDEEVWNKLRQQLRSLQDNINDITTKFAPPKTGSLSACDGTWTYPSKTPNSARSHRETDTRLLLHPQMSHIQSGRFQRVSHGQLPPPQTPNSASSNSSMRRTQAWHLQSHLPDEVIPSSATSESSAAQAYSQAGSCRRASLTSSATNEIQPGILPGFEAELHNPASRPALCPGIPGCPTRSTGSLNSVAPVTPRSAKITMHRVPLEIIGAPLSTSTATLPSGALSPGRPFVIVRPTTPQAMTPRLMPHRRMVPSPAGQPGQHAGGYTTSVTL